MRVYQVPPPTQVSRVGIEPTISFENTALNRARLPVPPPRHNVILAKPEGVDNFYKICQHELFMRKIILSISFFVLTPLFICLNIFYYFYLSYHQTANLHAFNNSFASVAFAQSPSSKNTVANQQEEDKKIKTEIVRQFFAKYNSPIEPFTQDVIDAANMYNLDYRLIPAIAMQESNLCRKIPTDSYNCWGFGIYGNRVVRFKDYKEAIYSVSKTLANNYIGKGFTTPEEIMIKYTPSNTGEWARSVNYFMSLLK